jgi:multiple sugar transport system substrate-binding protein
MADLDREEAMTQTIARRAIGRLLGATAILALTAGLGSATAETLTVWWNKGFYEAEDAALESMVKKWEEQTGNTVNLSFYSTADVVAKVISGMNSNAPPDIAYADLNDFAIAPLQAWKGNLADVSDIVQPLEGEYTETALKSARLYNNEEGKRSYYAIPLKQQALHDFYWRPLIEKAGFTDADIPREWDAYWQFWRTVQDKLRDERMRVYAVGFPMSARDSDNYYTFNQYLVAFGGEIVKPDGTLNIDDPKTREAAIGALTFMTDLHKDGYVPPGAINWGDADNNVAFFSKQIVMTSNATISIPVAKFDEKELYLHEIVTRSQPLTPDGEVMTSLVAVKVAMIPKHAEHVDLAKEFMKFFVTPENLNDYLKTARGRWMPVMPSIVENDPYWTDPSDPHRPVVVEQEVKGPTAPWPMAYNPAYAEVNAKQVWGKAEGNVIVNGMTPEEAVDAAFAEIKQIFAGYDIPKS